MRFRRRRGVDLGTFEPPPAVPLSPVSRVVDEGVLISSSTVRMALKNRLIVAALRDRLDYDRAALTRAAREEFELLARENDDTADRLEQLREIEEAEGEPDFSEDEVRAMQHAAHRRRPGIHRLLATALRDHAEDDEQLALLVERARIDAWDEIGREITSQLHLREFDSRLDPDYERVRHLRIRQFVSLDLARILDEEPGAERAGAGAEAGAEVGVGVEAGARAERKARRETGPAAEDADADAIVRDHRADSVAVEQQPKS